MTAQEIRDRFLNYFESKAHKIVASAPMVIKDDPTLMFTNAGMNQFKDIFLGNEKPEYLRVVDTQKCLRVSGKHNDLEEVGKDSYHHTMFEMLGNWSFGDYFKEEAIAYAYELLTEVYKLDSDRLYATIFEGDADDGTSRDEEAYEIWKRYLPEGRILNGDKKDNFWEMGDTGPCGPCSEIHIDIRDEEARKKIDGKELVNQDHPLVIEIWNLVFIQYDRKSDGKLTKLPQQHVDTGMGLERLVMAVQHKTSNYETDLFMPFINFVEEKTGIEYGNSYEVDAYSDIAMRVVVDHLRAVVFAIADGELPSNTGAGYVIRRILRRAVRYYYSYLNRSEPLLCKMVDILDKYFGDTFPEIREQKDFIKKVVREEEKNFLRTLSDGLAKIKNLNLNSGDILDGKTAFLLYDTYGFPLDLTELIAQEHGWTVDKKAFAEALQEQKSRSRQDALRQMGDWVIVKDVDKTEFVGYDEQRIVGTQITKYRIVKSKGEETYEIVLKKTPFYPEGGGQVGDIGYLENEEERIQVPDTFKINNLIIHKVSHLPERPELPITAEVNSKRRGLIENNHSATHLLHAALREVLGTHVHQKGSLLNDEYLRFDFSHYEAVSREELGKIERIVNEKIRENIPKDEKRNISIEEAKEAGAMMLFGEKYGNEVRMITFDPRYSRELCGGCHVDYTGRLGFFKITSESSVSAGVRRIEAVTSVAAENYVQGMIDELQSIKNQLKAPQHTLDAIVSLQEERKELKNQVHKLRNERVKNLKGEISKEIQERDGFNYLSKLVRVSNGGALKDMAFELLKSREKMVVVLGADLGEKAQLIVAMDKSLPGTLSKNAGEIIKKMSAEIKGGGGGQPFFASAGGSNPAGLGKAIDIADEYFDIIKV